MQESWMNTPVINPYEWETGPDVNQGFQHQQQPRASQEERLPPVTPPGPVESQYSGPGYPGTPAATATHGRRPTRDKVQRGFGGGSTPDTKQSSRGVGSRGAQDSDRQKNGTPKALGEAAFWNSMSGGAHAQVVDQAGRAATPLVPGRGLRVQTPLMGSRGVTTGSGGRECGISTPEEEYRRAGTSQGGSREMSRHASRPVTQEKRSREARRELATPPHTDIPEEACFEVGSTLMDAWPRSLSTPPHGMGRPQQGLGVTTPMTKPGSRMMITRGSIMSMGSIQEEKRGRQRRLQQEPFLIDSTPWQADPGSKSGHDLSVKVMRHAPNPLVGSKPQTRSSKTGLSKRRLPDVRSRTVTGQQDFWRNEMHSKEAMKIARVLRNRSKEAEREQQRAGIDGGEKMAMAPQRVSTAPPELRAQADELGFDIDALPFKRAAQAMPRLMATGDRHRFYDTFIDILADQVVAVYCALLLVEAEEGHKPRVRRIEKGGPYGAPWMALDDADGAAYHGSALSKVVRGSTVCIDNVLDNASPMFQTDRDEVGTNFVTDTLLSVPLKDASGKTFAVAELRNKRSGHGFPFTASDVEVTQTICETAAVLLQDIEKRHEMQVQLQRFQGVQKTAFELFWELDKSKTAHHVKVGAQGALQAQSVSLFLVDKEHEELHRVVGEGSPGKKGDVSAIGHGLAGHCALYSSMSNVPDAHSDPRYNPAVDRESDLIESQAYDKRNILTVPVCIGSDMLAVLQLTNRVDGELFDTHDETCALSLADVAARGLQNGFAHDTLMQKNSVLHRELDIHKKIAQSCLVVNPPDVSNLKEVATTVVNELCSMVPCSGARLQMLCGVQLWRVAKSAIDGSETPDFWENPVEINSPAASRTVLGSEGGLLGRCISQGETFCCADAPEEQLFRKDADSISNIRVKGMVLVPLVAPQIEIIPEGMDAAEATRAKYNLPPYGVVASPVGCVVGVLQLVNKSDGMPFDAVDEQTAMALGNVATAHLLRAVSRVNLIGVAEEKAAAAECMSPLSPPASPL